jgi:hypothetical protein
VQGNEDGQGRCETVTGSIAGGVARILWIRSSRTHTRSAAIPLGFRVGAWAKVWENRKGLDLTGAEDGAQKPATPDAMVATPAKARTALLELISQRRCGLRTPFCPTTRQKKNCQIKYLPTSTKSGEAAHAQNEDVQA